MLTNAWRHLLMILNRTDRRKSERIVFKIRGGMDGKFFAMSKKSFQEFNCQKVGGYKRWSRKKLVFYRKIFFSPKSFLFYLFFIHHLLMLSENTFQINILLITLSHRKSLLSYRHTRTYTRTNTHTHWISLFFCRSLSLSRSLSLLQTLRYTFCFSCFFSHLFFF